MMEYSGFVEVACVKCGHTNSIKVDTWGVSFRSNWVSHLTALPSIYKCDNCHSYLNITIHVNFEFSTVVIEPDEKKVESPVMQIRAFRVVKPTTEEPPGA